MPIPDQALGLAAGLLTAYATGTWRKYGHRLERLHELRQALPDHADALRAEFDERSREEADRLVAHGLVRPPTRILASRLVLRSILTLWAVLVVVIIAGSRPWVALGREVGRLQIESRRPGQFPLWALVTNEAIVWGSIPLAMVTGAVLVEYWYRHLTTPTFRQRGLYWLARSVLSLLIAVLFFSIVDFYDKGFAATNRFLPPLWLRLLIVLPIAGFLARRAWRKRHHQSDPSPPEPTPTPEPPPPTGPASPPVWPGRVAAALATGVVLQGWRQLRQRRP